MGRVSRRQCDDSHSSPGGAYFAGASLRAWTTCGVRESRESCTGAAYQILTARCDVIGKCCICDGYVRHKRAHLSLFFIFRLERFFAAFFLRGVG